MSWIYENTLSWIQRVCFYILKCGVIPKHIAIIMDGNRRFAKRNCVQKYDGHKKGFDKLAETLQWCLHLDISEVTVYAFSIGNFKRNKDEVDDLMKLAKEKFKILINEWEKLREHGICIRVVGNLTLVPKDVRALLLIAILLTSGNTRAFLNIAFSYTGREELCNTSEQIVQGIKNKNINEADVSSEFVDDCLYTFRSVHPDLILRTSGESRISNFLLWQCANSYVHFINALWPDFSAWHLMSAVFNYQQFYGKLRKFRLQSNSTLNNENCINGRLKTQKIFPKLLQNNRFTSLMASCLDVGVLSDIMAIKSYSPEQIYQYYELHIVPFYLSY